MGVVISLIASRLCGFFKPRNRFIYPSEVEEIGADIVIRVAEIWIHRYGLFALFDRLFVASLKAQGPAEKCVGLCGRVTTDRLLVEAHRFFQLSFHLTAIGLAEEFHSPFQVFFFVHLSPMLDGGHLVVPVCWSKGRNSRSLFTLLPLVRNHAVLS